MKRRLVDLLDESALACNLLMGLSLAAAIVFGLLAIASGLAALFTSVWWLWGFVLFGLLAGIATGLAGYIFDEHL